MSYRTCSSDHGPEMPAQQKLWAPCGLSLCAESIVFATYGTARLCAFSPQCGGGGGGPPMPRRSLLPASELPVVRLTHAHLRPASRGARLPRHGWRYASASSLWPAAARQAQFVQGPATALQLGRAAAAASSGPGRSCSCVARQLRAARAEPRWGRLWRKRVRQLGLEEA